MTAIIGTTGVVTVSAVTGAQLFGFHLGQAAAKDAVGADPTSTAASTSSSDDPSTSGAGTSLDPVYVHVKQYYDEVVQVSTEAPTAATRAVAAAARGTSTWAATNPATNPTSKATQAPTTKATQAPTTKATAAPTAPPTVPPTAKPTTPTTARPRTTTTTGTPYNFNAWRAAHPGANLGNWPQLHPTQAPPTYTCGARGGQLEDNGVWNCQ
jgi:hypothetical protein